MSVSGLLLIHKAHGCTSSYVTAQVKKVLRTQTKPLPKVGHMGTLDPFATGLLPIAIGSSTKLLPFIADASKTYQFTVQWGTQTSTADLSGEVLETSSVRPSEEEIQKILPQFRGDIFQTPPHFSALKVGGRRAYALARAGVAFELAPRAQHVFRLKLLENTLHTATFDVMCNTGTYVRSLGQDIARALGTCGHLTSLKRTAIGKWRDSDAIPLDSFCEIAHDKRNLQSLLMPPLTLLDDIPACEVSEEEVRRLCRGQPLMRGMQTSSAVVACVQGSELIALVREKEEGVWAPFRVFWDDKRSKHDVDDKRT